MAIPLVGGGKLESARTMYLLSNGRTEGQTTKSGKTKSTTIFDK